MTTHRATVRVYHHGTIFDPGEVVAYMGPPDWKYEPTDRDARDAWLLTAARPEQVSATRWEQDRLTLASSSRKGEHVTEPV